MVQALARPTLSSNPDEIRRRFFECSSGRDVAELLEISYSHLVYILFRAPDRYPYRTFEIPKKSGGTRTIEAPAGSVQILQSKVNEVLQLAYARKPAAHGFIRDYSILTNARPHAGKRFVLNLDLKDFFPTIHFGRVRGVFIAPPYELGEEAATYLARICCNADHLPQGGPASPMISNLVCARLDGQLARLAKRFRCDYTRYADDITFSTTRKTFPSQLADPKDAWSGTDLRLGSDLIETIESNGFEINREKLRLQSAGRHQEVTGLTVNEFANVPRRFVRRVRAMIHAWEKYGLDAAQEEYRNRYAPYRHPSAEPPSFARVVKGRLDFIRMVKGEAHPVFRNLARRVHELDDRLFEAYPDQLGVDRAVQILVDQQPPVPSRSAYQGIVIIFLTDIVGSTQLQVELGDIEYNRLRREHDVIIRREIKNALGATFNHTGDGLFATFQSARRALSCAIATQQKISQFAESVGQPMAIKLALHAGEPEPEGDNFFGIDVNFTARVIARAQPGEVLCSAAVKGLVAGVPGFEFRYRGNFSLKGIPGRHPLYALKIEDPD